MAVSIKYEFSRIESKVTDLEYQIETAKNIDGDIDEDMKRIFLSIHLDLKNKLDDIEDRKRKDEEESEVVFLKEVTAKEASLSYCTSCKKCATLNSTEKSF